MFLSTNSQSGIVAVSSGTNSPSSVIDSALSGASSEDGRLAKRRMRETFFDDNTTAWPSSVSVDSRRNSSSNRIRSRRIRAIFSTK